MGRILEEENYTVNEEKLLLNDVISLYDHLPVEILAGFYYHINKNVEDGILSDAMYHEINLIERAAKKRGVSLNDLYDLGSSVV